MRLLYWNRYFREQLSLLSAEDVAIVIYSIAAAILDSGFGLEYVEWLSCLYARLRINFAPVKHKYIEQSFSWETQAINEFFAFCETQMFIILFLRDRHWSLSLPHTEFL